MLTDTPTALRPTAGRTLLMTSAVTGSRPMRVPRDDPATGQPRDARALVDAYVLPLGGRAGWQLDTFGAPASPLSLARLRMAVTTTPSPGVAMTVRCTRCAVSPSQLMGAGLRPPGHSEPASAREEDET